MVLARSAKAAVEGFLKYKTGSKTYFPHVLGKSFGATVVILDHDFCFSVLLFILLPTINIIFLINPTCRDALLG